MAKTKQVAVPSTGNLTLQQAKDSAKASSVTKKCYVIQDGDKGFFIAYAPLPGKLFGYFQGKEIDVSKVPVKEVKKMSDAAVDKVVKEKKELKISESVNVSAEPKETQISKPSKNKSKMKTTKKVAAKVVKKSAKKTTSRPAISGIKEGAKVTYKGKSYTVDGTKTFKGKPYVNISNTKEKHSVSANKIEK